MKSLCITGSAQSLLEHVAAHVELAGAAPSLAAKREPEMTISTWHTRVCSALDGRINQYKKGKKIGRVWEQFAGDIFYNNHQQELWYWGEERSAELLDFWADFDPNIYFIIIHTPLELALQLELKNNKPAENSVNTIIEKWIVCTQNILNFKISHTNRCEIVDINDYYAEPAACLGFIAEKWEISLTAAKVKPVAIPTVAPEYYYLSSILSNDYPAINSIKNDLIGHKLQGNDFWRHHYRDRAIKMLETLNDSQISPQPELSAGSPSMAMDLSGDQNTLTQLLTLQELYEDLSWKNKNPLIADAQPAALQTEQLQKALSNLHFAQELLEEKIVELHHQNSSLRQHQELLISVAKQEQRCWILGDFTAETIALNSSRKISCIQCDLKHLFINNQLTPKLKIEIHYNEHMAGIKLFRPDIRSSAPLQQWPLDFADDLYLNCIPSTGHAFEGGNAVISSLSTSDWSFIQGLVGVLTKTFEESNTALSNIQDSATVLKGLLALERTLNKWPLIARHDRATLVQIVQNENYNALECTVKNLTIGATKWPDLEFRISTVDDISGEFGANPRIELLPSMKKTMDSWFIESDDPERGPRLELRFAHPEMMDIMVWNKLSESDRLMITAIVTDLPRQLRTFTQLTIPQMKRWETLASTLAATLKKYSISTFDRVIGKVTP